jgi:hypothetical protein
MRSATFCLSLGILLFAAGCSSPLEGWHVRTQDIGTYSGNFRNGYPDGRGTSEYSDGKIYEGNWKRGAWSGKGTLTLTDGVRYEGTWRGTSLNGPGVVYYADGTKHTGSFKDSKREGQWKRYGADGELRGEDYYENGELRKISVDMKKLLLEGILEELREEEQTATRVTDEVVKYLGEFAKGVPGNMSRTTLGGLDVYLEEGFSPKDIEAKGWTIAYCAHSPPDWVGNGLIVRYCDNQRAQAFSEGTSSEYGNNLVFFSSTLPEEVRDDPATEASERPYDKTILVARGTDAAIFIQRATRIEFRALKLDNSVPSEQFFISEESMRQAVAEGFEADPGPYQRLVELEKRLMNVYYGN